MGVTNTRDQRDAIDAAVMNHLSGIADVWRAVERREFADAQRLGRAFAEDLRLLYDLGWGETTERETVALTMPIGECAAPLPGCTATPPARLRPTSPGRRRTKASPSAILPRPLP
jgi:hypothetical protein